MDAAEQGRGALEGAQIITLPGQEIIKVRATPYVWRPAIELPRQQWVYGYELQRGQLSAIIAPGASGKSTYIMARAINMAGGVARFRQRVWNGPHKVWYWNLEDSRLHMERMLQAFCLLYQIQPEEIEGRLFLDSAVVNPPGDAVEYEPQILKLATEERERGFTLHRPFIDALVAELRDRQIDHLDIDPFVSSHGVSENDSGSIDKVTKEWARVAAAANCSISLAHHVRKVEGRDVTVLDARGSSSLAATCRSMLVINGMNAETADKCGVERNEGWRYFSVTDGKNNRAPTPESDWYRKEGVGLGNGNDLGPEDKVAAITRFVPPSIFGGLTPEKLRWVQDAIKGDHRTREHFKSGGSQTCQYGPLWVGNVIADALGLSLDHPADLAKVKNLQRVWLDNGLLARVERDNGRSEMKWHVTVGQNVLD